jgi:hypothetical protein
MSCSNNVLTIAAAMRSLSEAEAPHGAAAMVKTQTLNM